MTMIASYKMFYFNLIKNTLPQVTQQHIRIIKSYSLVVFFLASFSFPTGPFEVYPASFEP